MESVAERLEKHLSKKGNSRPWAYGMKGELSKEARGVWELLSEKEKLLVSRHCPSKNERNRQISTLRDLGVTYPVLSEISGLSIRTISYIVGSKTDE